MSTSFNIFAQHALPDTYNIIKNNATVLDVRNNDNYAINDYVTVPFQNDSGVIFFAPQHGHVFYLNNYSVMYVPDSGYIGQDEFVYSIAYYDKYYYSIDTARVYLTVANPQPAYCQAHFNTSSGSCFNCFHLLDDSQGDVVSWQWTFGDGETSIVRNPDHHFQIAGTYNVCLEIITTDNCISHYCTNVEAIASDSCYADFSFTAPVNHSVAFTDQSLGNITNWTWTFGDDSNAVTRDPLHCYHATGHYQACLTVLTANACTSTVCKEIQIDQPLLDTIVLFGGHVFAGNNLLHHGVAILFDVANHYKAIDWNYIYNDQQNQGIWFFSAAPGNYLVYIIPDYDYQLSWNKMYFPTYLGDKLFWQDATTFNINSSNGTLDIHLCSTDSLSHFYGESSIHGNVFYTCDSTYEQNVFGIDWFNDSNTVAASTAKSNAALNMPVLLLDGNNNPVRFMLSNHSGAFDFNSIANKNYKIYTEKAGMFTVPVLLTTDEQNTEISDISIYVGSTNITSGIADNANSSEMQALNIFPVPVTNILHINIELVKSETLDITIADISGKAIYHQTSYFGQGKNKTEIDTRNFNEGIYFIVFTDADGKIFTSKFIK